MSVFQVSHSMSISHSTNHSRSNGPSLTLALTALRGCNAVGLSFPSGVCVRRIGTIAPVSHTRMTSAFWLMYRITSHAIHSPLILDTHQKQTHTATFETKRIYLYFS